MAESSRLKIKDSVNKSDRWVFGSASIAMIFPQAELRGDTTYSKANQDTVAVSLLFTFTVSAKMYNNVE